MIDNLPNGWKEEKIGNIIDLTIGKTPSRKKSEYFTGDNLWVSIADIKSINLTNTKEKITEQAIKDSNIKKVKAGTLIMSYKLSIGKMAFTSQDLYTNEAIVALNIKINDLDKKFLYYYLLNADLEKTTDRAVKGKTLNKAKIEQIHIQFPLLQQQEKIVKVLDLTSNLIEKQKELLEKYDLFLKSKFIEMFGDPSKNIMNWNIDKFEKYIEYIGDIGSNGSNAVISKNLKMIDTEDYALMIRTTNLNKNDFINDVKFVSEETYNFFKKSKIFGGEIIMNKIGSAGKFWKMPYLNRPVSLGLNQLVIRLKNLNTEYLYYLLSTEYGRVIINSKTNGAVTQSITKGAVKDIDIMVPPIELQNKFASIVEKIETIKEKENQKLKQLEDLHNSMMNKAFKGEIK